MGLSANEVARLLSVGTPTERAMAAELLRLRELEAAVLASQSCKACAERLRRMGSGMCPQHAGERARNEAAIARAARQGGTNG